MAAKALMIRIDKHQENAVDPANIDLYITFRVSGLSYSLGDFETTITVEDIDTAATITTKIQNAVIARAAEYGVTLTAGDIIPVVRGVPDTLMSAANSSTITLTDDGINQYFVGSLGGIRLQPSSIYPILTLEAAAASFAFSNAGFVSFFEYGQFGTNDVWLQGLPATSAGYTVLEAGGNSAGLVLSTEQNNPISFRPNRVKVAEFDAGGLTMAAGVEVNSVAKQTYTVTNLTTDRTYNANSATLDELCDVVGTLIGDLRTIGMVA